MQRLFLLSLLLLILVPALAIGSNGMVTIESSYSVDVTADRHGISDCGQVLGKMTGALKAFAEKATK